MSEASLVQFDRLGIEGVRVFMDCSS